MRRNGQQPDLTNHNTRLSGRRRQALALAHKSWKQPRPRPAWLACQTYAPAGQRNALGRLGATKGEQAEQAEYKIYQRSAFELKPQSELAAEYGLSQQRVSQVLRNAERWMTTHPDYDEAQRMRVRVHSRWEALFGTAMRMFDRSRQDQEIVKERTTRRAPEAAAEKAVTTTLNEKTVKQ